MHKINYMLDTVKIVLRLYQSRVKGVPKLGGGHPLPSSIGILSLIGREGYKGSWRS